MEDKDFFEILREALIREGKERPTFPEDMTEHIENEKKKMIAQYLAAKKLKKETKDEDTDNP